MGKVGKNFTLFLDGDGGGGHGFVLFQRHPELYSA